MPPFDMIVHGFRPAQITGGDAARVLGLDL
jgi:hypothetical protein